MKVFIDNEFMCHVDNDGTMREVETDFFDGKCRGFIEGYRFVPEGESRISSGGVRFTGEMITPWRDCGLLAELQAQYEEMLAEAEDMRNALNAIYGGVTDE